MTRAQTTIDFAIGISLFLIVTAFVIAFVPTIFTPFESAESPETADRIATSLATDRLGDPANPYILSERCTNAFFEQLNGGNPGPTGCLYSTTANTTAELFGLDDTRKVNVTIRHANGSIVDAGVRLAAGPTTPDTTSVSSATRVVSLSGETRRLLVRTW
jgi:hypothetical protein